MKRTIVLAVAAAAALATVPGSGAVAAPERTGSVNAGQTYTWNGAAEVNANPFYFAQVAQQPNVDPIEQGTCSSEPHQQCDEILVKFINPLTQAEIDKGVKSKFRSTTIDVNEYAPVAQATDFDLHVFASDATGANKGYFTGSSTSSQSGELIGSPESLTVEIETTKDQPEVWMLIRVIRFFSPNASYKGTVSF